MNARIGPAVRDTRLRSMFDVPQASVTISANRCIALLGTIPRKIFSPQRAIPVTLCRNDSHSSAKKMVKSNNTQLSRFARFALGRLFPLPFIAIGTFLTYFQTTAFYRAHQSKSWPKTTGVVHINIGEYRRNISYQYSVNGANYSSDRVIFGEDNGGRNPSKEWNIVSEFPSGKRVDVYYMPQNPEVSTLFTEVREDSWFQLSQGMVFLFAGVIIFTSLPKFLKRTAEEAEAHRPA